jgi:uncharacterized protein YecE (DUF72 family)
MPGKARIGISGWRYPPWRDVFYPEDLPQRLELHYASRLFKTIEINGSFYALQSPESYAKWYEDTPRGFVFSIKAPRYITHIRRLRDVKTPICNFFASGVLTLKEKLGPFLWQLPPSFRYDTEAIEQFLALLPHNTQQLASMSRSHDEFLSNAVTSFDKSRKVRHAIEIRHDSFACDAFIEQLRRYNVSLVVADTAGKWPLLEDITADFIYMRLHGDKELYASGYTPKALRDWHRRIEAWLSGRQPRGARRCTKTPAPSRQQRDVYCYFDNDIKVMAPRDASKLDEMLNGPSK